MKKFFKELDKLYYRKEICVKWYLQHATFSFAIYREEDAFVPTKALHESKVYNHFRVDKTFRKEVMNDIYDKIKEFKPVKSINTKHHEQEHDNTKSK